MPERKRYYLGACIRPEGLVAELAISTDPVSEAVITAAGENTVAVPCPLHGGKDGHLIVLAEVSASQFAHGAGSDADTELYPETTRMVRSTWLPEGLNAFYEDITQAMVNHANGGGDELPDSDGVLDQLARLQLIAEELDLNWQDLVVEYTSPTQRTAMRDLIGDDNG